MGKHKRRPRRQKRSSTEEAQPLTPSGPAIVQRIRHADPATRQAAMAGLQHARVLTASPSSVVLSAVAEQVASPDMDCNIQALACLAEYLQQPSIDATLTAGWLALFVQCLAAPADEEKPLARVELALQCTAALLENNPSVMARLIPSSSVFRNAQLRDDTTSTLTQWLARARSVKDAPFQALYDSIAILSARCLHSLLDDNLALVEPWLAEASAQATLQVLQTTLSDGGKAGLHAIGSWLSLYTVLEPRSEAHLTEPKALLAAHLADCVAGLAQELSFAPDPTQVAELVSAHVAWLEEQQDDALERQIVRHQADKKESARDIARRLQQDKHMAEEDNGRGRLDPYRCDRQEQYEQHEQWWSIMMRPKQLALEIVANITSTETGLTDEDDVVMVEAQLDGRIAELVLTNQVPERVQTMLEQLVGDWRPPGGCLPVALIESVADLQAKACACLGHCLVNLPQWKPNMTLWNVFKATLTSVSAHEGSVFAAESVSAAMALALRSRPTVRQQIGAAELDFLLNLTSHGIPEVVRDAVSMLGILCCQEEHPASVNLKASQGILQARPKKSDKVPAMVLSEVLSVLMDIYGDDDRHPDVFESLSVLGFFQQSVPTLKGAIKAEASSASPMDLEQWSETAMNASRFIEYKKDQR